MADPNAVVSRTIRIERPDGSAAEKRADLIVALDGDRRAVLPADDPRSAGYAQVLEGLEQLHRPVYLELDPDSDAIKTLLIPHVGRALSMRAEGGHYLVEFAYSHGLHRLDGGSPDFAQLERALRTAIETREPLIVTETDAHRIIDVRPFVPGPDDGPLPDWPLPKWPPARLDWRWKLRCWLRKWLFWWWPRGCISSGRAQQVFDAMEATTCAPLTVPPPCIPFLYPDDGCWGRAHEMCRLMIAMGLSPRKVWIQGNLHTPTRNNPNCAVYWGWHVAPTLCVRRFLFFTQRRVIDPSLFTKPVSETTWKGVQGDPNATLTPSSADIFYLWGNQTDPTYAQTNAVLATYRLMLQTRSIQIGPPPYANCP